MHDDSVPLGDKLMEFLMVIGEGRPGASDHAVDAIVPLAKRFVRAIVGDEITRVEVWNPIKTPPVPDDLGELSNDRFVSLDGVQATHRRAGGMAAQPMSTNAAAGNRMARRFRTGASS
jgi:hypothetical protein